ncbi:MAG: hypothetical protein ACE5OY_02135 [Candidatus Bathyarchaeia archaeon]
MLPAGEFGKDPKLTSCQRGWAILVLVALLLVSFVNVVIAHPDSITETTDVHFDAGAFFQTMRAGTGTEADVRLSKHDSDNHALGGTPSTDGELQHGSISYLDDGDTATHVCASLNEGQEMRVQFTGRVVYKIVIREGNDSPDSGYTYAVDAYYNGAWNQIGAFVFENANTVRTIEISEQTVSGVRIRNKSGTPGVCYCFREFEAYGRVYHASGDFTSKKLDTGGSYPFAQIRWSETLPSGCDLMFQFRAADTPSELDGVAFEGPTGTDDYFTNPIGEDIPRKWDCKRYFQYKALFSSTDMDQTPEMEDVTVEYTRNRAPTNDELTLVDPDIGSQGCLSEVRSYTFRVRVTDADGPTNLSYVELTLDYSGQNIRIRWSESSDSFTETNDPDEYIELVSTGADSSYVGSQWTLDFKVRFLWSYPDEDPHDCRLYSIDDASESDDVIHYGVYRVIKQPLNDDVSGPVNAYAARPFQVNVTVSDGSGVDDIRSVIVALAPQVENLRYQWNNSTGTPTWSVVADTNGLGQIDEESCLIKDLSPTTRRFVFVLTIDWSFTTEGEIDVEVISEDRTGARDQDTFPGELAFENDLEVGVAVDGRADIGSEVSFSGHIYYEGSSVPPPKGIRVRVNEVVGVTDEEGAYDIHLTLPSSVGSYNFSVSCDHGIENKTLSVIADRVRVNLSVSRDRTNVGDGAPITYSAHYEYDGASFEGTIRFNNRLAQDSVGKYSFRADSIKDDGYGLSSFETNEVSVIFDRVEVYEGGTEDDRVDAGREATYWFRLRYSYDHESVTDGEVSLNEGQATYDPSDRRWEYRLSYDGIGRIERWVTSVSRNRYGITAFSDSVGPLSVIYDRIRVVRITVSDARCDAGTSQQIQANLVYEYDGATFDGDCGLVYLNQAPMEWDPSEGCWEFDTGVVDQVTERSYVISGLDDRKYGLRGIDNPAGGGSIIWDRIKVEEAGSNGTVLHAGESVLIWIKAIYEFDGTPFGSSTCETYVLGQPARWDGDACRWEFVDTSSESNIKTYAISSLTDTRYGLRSFNDAALKAMVIHWLPKAPEPVPTVGIVSGGIENDGASPGDPIIVWFIAKMEDGSILDGSRGRLYVNDGIAEWNTDLGRWEMEAVSFSEGSEGFTVTKATDADGLEFSLDDQVGRLIGHWTEERVVSIVAGGLENNGTAPGNEIVIWFLATYNDGSFFDEPCGSVYVNDREARWNPTAQRWESSFVRVTEGSETFRVTQVVDKKFGSNFTSLVRPLIARWERPTEELAEEPAEGPVDERASVWGNGSQLILATAVSVLGSVTVLVLRRRL